MDTGKLLETRTPTELEAGTMKVDAPQPPSKPNLEGLGPLKRKTAVKDYRKAMLAYGRSKRLAKLGKTPRRILSVKGEVVTDDDLQKAVEAIPGALARTALIAKLGKSGIAEIVATLYEIACDKENKTAALRAIEQILDRLDGKPSQMIQQTGQTELKVTVRKIGM